MRENARHVGAEVRAAGPTGAAGTAARDRHEGIFHEGDVAHPERAFEERPGDVVGDVRT